MQDGYLDQEPRNPLSPASVVAPIVVTNRSGFTGADMDPSTAGWVFNTTSGWGGMIYAARLGD